MIKKLNAFFLLLLCLVLFCACVNGVQTTAPLAKTPAPVSGASAVLPGSVSAPKLLFTLPTMHSQSASLLAQGVQDRCDELGILVTMHSSHMDHSAQALQIDAFVESGGNAILCWPVDALAIQPFLAIARLQGLFVVSYGKQEESSAQVLPNYSGAGQLLGKAAANWAQESQDINAVLLLDENGGPAGFKDGVLEGFLEILPNGQIEAMAVKNNLNMLADVLKENPNANIFLANSTELALLVQKALKEHWINQLKKPPEGFELANYFFGSLHTAKTPFEIEESQNLNVNVGENAYQAGQAMVDLALQLIEGKSPEQYIVPAVIVGKSH